MAKGKSGGSMTKYLFVGAVGLFVAWHFYPKSVETAGKTIADKGGRALKAAGNEITK